MLTFTKPGIEEYAESKSQRPGQILDELMLETYDTMNMPQMVTGPLEGQMLRFMALLTNAKRILEIGMFTGYSALSMAEALPADGRLDTLEIDPKAIAVANKYFAQSEHGKKIQ